MRRYLIRSCVVITGVAIVGMTSRTIARDKRVDFGAFVAEQLSEHSEELFGFRHPLEQSALGPYDGPDNVQAIQVADGLRVSLVSSGVASAADQIALWPNDDRPTHVFVCDEETSNPSVQRVDLSKPASANATTIVAGLTSCDPVRRTPWGTIIVAEEAGATGGFYEIINPLSIDTVINVTDRDMGTTSDPRLVKRKAVGSLSFESFGIKNDGTMIYGDELAPIGGNAGGAIYKFVPDVPYREQRSRYGCCSIATRVGNDLWSARGRRGWFDQLGPGRRNRQGSLGGRQQGRLERRRRRAERDSANRPAAPEVHRVLPARRHGRRSNRRQGRGLQSVLGQYRPVQPHRQQRGREQRRSERDHVPGREPSERRGAEPTNGNHPHR